MNDQNQKPACDRCDDLFECDRCGALYHLSHTMTNHCTACGYHNGFYTDAPWTWSDVLYIGKLLLGLAASGVFVYICANL